MFDTKASYLIVTPGSEHALLLHTTRAHLNISANLPETSLDSLQPFGRPST
jgi:hypothetical protein